MQAYQVARGRGLFSPYLLECLAAGLFFACRLNELLGDIRGEPGIEGPLYQARSRIAIAIV